MIPRRLLARCVPLPALSPGDRTWLAVIRKPNMPLERWSDPERARRALRASNRAASAKRLANRLRLFPDPEPMPKAPKTATGQRGVKRRPRLPNPASGHTITNTKETPS